MLFEAHTSQLPHWPATGRHILAHYDADSIVVYQAYRPEIADHAIAHQAFGGAFSFGRMSWIKPNFLWMMYRSGWGAKPGQERTLALRLRRPFFDALLGRAVASSFDPTASGSMADWPSALANSDVRLQWDPDHDPDGLPLPRRALQLGLRGATLAAFATRPDLIEVIDMTSFVAAQRDQLAKGGIAVLTTPRERVYRPTDPAIARNIGLGSAGDQE
jgi:Domain of unknown function (DUF4291)